MKIIELNCDDFKDTANHIKFVLICGSQAFIYDKVIKPKDQIKSWCQIFLVEVLKIPIYEYKQHNKNVKRVNYGVTTMLVFQLKSCPKIPGFIFDYKLTQAFINLGLIGRNKRIKFKLEEGKTKKHGIDEELQKLQLELSNNQKEENKRQLNEEVEEAEEAEEAEEVENDEEDEEVENDEEDDDEDDDEDEEVEDDDEDDQDNEEDDEEDDDEDDDEDDEDKKK